MLNMALNSFHDALTVLLRNQVEKRAILENYDLVMLCLDETIDDGYAVPFLLITLSVVVDSDFYET